MSAAVIEYVGDGTHETVCYTCGTGYRGSKHKVEHEARIHRNDHPSHDIVGPREVPR